MNELIIWLAVVALGSLGLTFALRAEFKRIEERRREEAVRRFLATNPLALKLKADTAAMQKAIGERLIPALASLSEAMTAWANDPKTQETMKRIGQAGAEAGRKR